MSQAFPSLDLDSLPPPVRAALEAQARELEGERAARAHLEAEVQELAAHNTRLEHLVRELQRARFGRKSEKLDADQLALTFEDIEIAIGEAEEAQEQSTSRARTPRSKPKSGGASRSLPKDLPRIEKVIEPESRACPCGCGEMVKIGEDVSERLDIVPAQLRFW